MYENTDPKIFDKVFGNNPKTRPMLNIEKTKAIEDANSLLFMYTENLLNQVDILGSLLRQKFMSLKASETVVKPPEPFVEKIFLNITKAIAEGMYNEEAMKPFIESAEQNQKAIQHLMNEEKNREVKSKLNTPGIT